MQDDDKKTAEIVDAPNDAPPDENLSIFVYGNIKIRDVDTGEIVVNLRF